MVTCCNRYAVSSCLRKLARARALIDVRCWRGQQRTKEKRQQTKACHRFFCAGALHPGLN